MIWIPISEQVPLYLYLVSKVQSIPAGQSNHNEQMRINQPKVNRLVVNLDTYEPYAPADRYLTRNNFSILPLNVAKLSEKEEKICLRRVLKSSIFPSQ
jgi:hypothetical protein